MTTTSSELPITLYHYSFSPYARRVVWYLKLRGIPFAECKQPPMLPRPDVTRLGIRYRRIPLLAIGRDVYLDSRLILSKLEAFNPPSAGPKLGAAPGTDARALERLLEVLHVDSGVFFHAASLLPWDLPMLKDPKFRADRADLFKGSPVDQSGGGGGKDEALARRAEAVGEVRRAFTLLETTLLADGREWVLKTSAPSLADIEAVWPLHWALGIPGMLPTETVNAEKFPNVFAWVDRFEKALRAAETKSGKPRTVTGEEAQSAILSSPHHESEKEVDAEDPLVKQLGLRKGQEVMMYPTDSGSAHKDRGRLVSINADEVVIETIAGSEAEALRVHAPTHGFRVRPVSSTKEKL